jgi:hypothetical protein
MNRAGFMSALASAALVVGTVAFASPAAADLQTHQFDATGESQSFTVPAGVTCVGIDAYGAGGGSATTNAGSPGAFGGFGGRSFAQQVPVTPGEVLTVLVGTQGGDGTVSSAGAGGFNGGADGGYAGEDGGGGGGGASTVLRGSVPLVIAGGGGGAGGDNPHETPSGGSGGGLVGTPGFDGEGTGGGGAGTQTAGGAAGLGPLVGTPGSAGQGGAGVAGGDAGSGGGGGGWFGGGSGGADQAISDGAGGGGGGSGYGPPGTFFETGAALGEGGVVFEWGSDVRCPAPGETPGTPADDLTPATGPTTAPLALTAAPRFTG